MTQKLLNSILFILSVNIGFSQSICLGEDAVVCVGSSITINNCDAGSGWSGDGIENLDSPTIITLSDDQWSPLINIGFPFSYYGTTYNQCVIGSNGLISFDLTEAGGFCSWSLAAAGTLPNPGFDDALNAVMVAYQDILPSAGGTVQYQTIGTAPNRRFVVLYQDVSYFSSSCNGKCNYMAAVFYETSNIVEMHIGNKDSCPAWNSGLGITGIQNANGTNAVIVPGCNNQVYDLNQVAFQFTPTSPSSTTNYTLSDIPYTYFTSPTSDVQWENTLGETFPYNAGSLTVTVTDTDSIGYYLTGESCGSSLGTVSDTSWIVGVNTGVIATATDDFCSSGFGSVTAEATAGIPPYIFNWIELGSNNQTETGLYAGTYTVQITDGNGCSAMTAVTVNDTPVDATATSTLISCPGGNDGTATATMVPELGVISYSWNDPLNQTTQTAVGLAAGTYTCTMTSDLGCYNTVDVIVDEIPGMVGTINAFTDVTCNSGSDGSANVNVTLGTAPYTYSWDNSTSTNSFATDLFAGTHNITVTDANGCQIVVSHVTGEPDPLSIVFLTPDTQICPEHSIDLSVQGSGGSSPYIFEWFENGNPIDFGTIVNVDPDYTNTQYCVTLTEECGSPSTTECMNITFPTPIIPDLEPDNFEQCVPGHFIFQNTSSINAEIATSFYDMGDTHFYFYNGNGSFEHTYNTVGAKDIFVQYTSVYGCVYTDTLEDVVNVLPKPHADFNFNGNPVSVFSPEISPVNMSSDDAISWEWFAPGSFETYSTEEYPEFTYPEGIEAVYPVTMVATSGLGCTDTIVLNLIVENDLIFFAPNTFTPDDDEFNQDWQFVLKNLDMYDFHLMIFDRWGEIIWETYDTDSSWDGTKNGRKVQSGTYVWVATWKNKNDDGKQIYNGYINLIR